MRKLFTLLVISAMAVLAACGPSAEEIAAQEKLDALQEQVRLDSIAEVEAAEAEAHQAELDSIQAIADAAKRQAAAAKKETKDVKHKASQQRDPRARKKAPAKKTVKAGEGKG